MSGHRIKISSLKFFSLSTFSRSIDLFSSKLNFKLDKYVSWKPGSGSHAVNVFRHKFHNEIFYITPFSVITKFLKKEDGLEGFIMVSMWNTEAFSPYLRNLLVAPPILLKWRKSLVHNPIDNKTHPMGKRLRLMACHLSKNVSKRTDFLQILSKLYLKVGESPPINKINFTLKSGSISVKNGALIPLQHV